MSVMPSFLKRPFASPTRSLLLLSAFSAAACLTVSAHASNLVTDGGFESAGGGNYYYAGSSIDNGAWTVGVGQVYIDNLDSYQFDGDNALNLGFANPNLPNSVSQVLSTIIGQTYVLNFWGDADSPNTISVTVNGVPVAGVAGSITDNGFPDAVDNSSLFTDYTGTFVATSALTTLNLKGVADLSPNAPATSDGSLVIDDVNVVPTPEPGSVILTLTGVLGLGLVLGRKRLSAMAGAGGSLSRG
jgi:hypothetical protein